MKHGYYVKLNKALKNTERFLVVPLARAYDEFSYDGNDPWVLVDTEHNEWNVSFKSLSDAEAVAADWNSEGYVAEKSLYVVGGQGFSLIERAMFRISKRTKRGNAVLTLVK